MPVYEYQCAACERTFEAWQKMSDRPVGKCEHCGSRRVSKLISQSAFHLKGSGWYKTDYAVKGNGGSEIKKSGSKKDSETGAGDSKTDASKGDAGKADASKGDASKGDASKGDASKADASKASSEKKDAASSASK